MGAPNRAVWIGPKNELFFKDIPEQYQPEANQGLIEVEYSGVNPADLKHGIDFGLNDSVAGYEFSGRVVKVGEGFPHRVGEAVFGSKNMGSHWKFGAHQDWMLVEGNSLMASRPSSIPSEAAAVISIVVRTAADALLNIMEIPFKSLNYAGTPSNSGIVIWGGASSVGMAAIQLAKAAGVNPIVTTASARNHQALKELGAHHVFDYSDKNVVSDIQGALEAAEGPLRYVFDAVCSSGELSSTQRCDALRTSPDALFVGTLPVQSTQRKWGWCLATRARDMPLPEPIGFVPANPVWERRLLEVMSWAAENYERGFRIPKVTVVEEEAKAIESIQASGEGKIRFEKIALKHPLRA